MRGYSRPSSNLIFPNGKAGSIYPAKPTAHRPKSHLNRPNTTPTRNRHSLCVRPNLLTRSSRPDPGSSAQTAGQRMARGAVPTCCSPSQLRGRSRAVCICLDPGTDMRLVEVCVASKRVLGCVNVIGVAPVMKWLALRRLRRVPLTSVVC